MAAAFPNGQYENWPICVRLFSHVQAALEYQPKGGGQRKWATLLHKGGWYALSHGRYDIAEQMAGKAQRARKKILGTGDLYWLTGRYCTEGNFDLSKVIAQLSQTRNFSQPIRNFDLAEVVHESSKHAISLNQSGARPSSLFIMALGKNLLHAEPWFLTTNDFIYVNNIDKINVIVNA